MTTKPIWRQKAAQRDKEEAFDRLTELYSPYEARQITDRGQVGAAYEDRLLTRPDTRLNPEPKKQR